MESISKVIILSTSLTPQVFTFKNNVKIRSITISKNIGDTVTGYFDGQKQYVGTGTAVGQGFVLHQASTYGLILINQVVKDVTYAGGINNFITIEFEDLKS